MNLRKITGTVALLGLAALAAETYLAKPVPKPTPQDLAKSTITAQSYITTHYNPDARVLSPKEYYSLEAVAKKDFVTKVFDSFARRYFIENDKTAIDYLVDKLMQNPDNTLTRDTIKKDLKREIKWEQTDDFKERVTRYYDSNRSLIVPDEYLKKGSQREFDFTTPALIGYRRTLENAFDKVSKVPGTKSAFILPDKDGGVHIFVLPQVFDDKTLTYETAGTCEEGRGTRSGRPLVLHAPKTFNAVSEDLNLAQKYGDSVQESGFFKVK